MLIHSGMCGISSVLEPTEVYTHSVRTELVDSLQKPKKPLFNVYELQGFFLKA